MVGVVAVLVGDVTVLVGVVATALLVSGETDCSGADVIVVAVVSASVESRSSGGGGMLPGFCGSGVESTKAASSEACITGAGSGFVGVHNFFFFLSTPQTTTRDFCFLIAPALEHVASDFFETAVSYQIFVLLVAAQTTVTPETFVVLPALVQAVPAGEMELRVLLSLWPHEVRAPRPITSASDSGNNDFFMEILISCSLYL